MQRIHITGASGSGTTTLGNALAARLCIPAHDADDFFWRRTDPPYHEKRAWASRNIMLMQRLNATEDWVLSGSIASWESGAEELFTLCVFLTVPCDLRIERLRKRELEQFGAEALAPGGVMHENHKQFIAWASRYDTAGTEQRSRKSHEAWLATLRCPILRIDGDVSVEERLRLITERLDA